MTIVWRRRSPCLQNCHLEHLAGPLAVPLCDPGAKPKRRQKIFCLRQHPRLDFPSHNSRAYESRSGPDVDYGANNLCHNLYPRANLNFVFADNSDHGRGIQSKNFWESTVGIAGPQRPQGIDLLHRWWCLAVTGWVLKLVFAVHARPLQ